MNCTVKTLGRILFITILASSAYLHLSRPETYVNDFRTNWANLTECTGKYMPGILPAAPTVSMTIIKDQLGIVG